MPESKSNTLHLPPKPKEQPQNLRYVPVKGRYILQERYQGRWRDVPLLTSESAAVCV